MQRFRIHKVHYFLGHETVTIEIEMVDGPFVGKRHDLFTTQEKLAEAAGSENWGDGAVRAVTAALLEPMGGTLEDPTPENGQ